MTEAYELVKKQGLNAVCFILLFWMNSRLENVENKLYSCWEAKADIIRQVSDHKQNKRTIYYAIIPHEVTIRDTKRHIKA